MIPILYQTATEGTVPSDYGIGALTDCLACSVTEERNGSYELEMSYASSGIHADEIQVNRIIKAKPNFTDNPQLFRIYKVGKNMNGRFEVKAQHISYDLSGKIITSGSASSCAGACAVLENNAGNFTISTTKTVVADFSITEPSSVRSWFGGKAGSLLDVYGTGEWEYDNYSATLKLNRGEDRGVTIRYGKNLTELSQEIDIQNLATAVQGYYKDSETGTVTLGTKTSTGLTLDYTKDIVVDFSSEVDTESATPIATQLDTLTNAYISRNQLGTAFKSITLNFAQNNILADRVDLCDTVHIYFEALGINTALKCIKVVWDTLAERYTSCTFGDSKVNITDTIVSVQKEIKDKPSLSVVENAAKYASDKITGNLGGYVINGYDSNGDGYPDENLVMNTDDISTATNVIRSNLGGIGFSTNGYAGPYQTAIGFSGIVADAITTGVLNANLIKAGVIEDVNHNSQIDMTTGIASLYQLIAKRDLTVKDINNVTKGFISCGDSGGIMLRFYDSTGTDYIVRLEQNANSGILYLIGDDSDLRLFNSNENTRIHASVNSSDGGEIKIYDTNDHQTIKLDGSAGRIKAPNTFDKVYDGSLSAIGAWWTFDTNFAGLLIVGKVKTTGSRTTMLVPVEMITATPTRLFLSDETNYTAFDIYLDNDLIKLEIAGKSSDGFVEKVYGIF